MTSWLYTLLLLFPTAVVVVAIWVRSVEITWLELAGSLGLSVLSIWGVYVAFLLNGFVQWGYISVCMRNTYRKGKAAAKRR